jgi:hypothetical protein
MDSALSTYFSNALLAGPKTQADGAFARAVILGLAQARYRIGLSSIVKLSQAQYQQTDAAIGNTNAQYQ